MRASLYSLIFSLARSAIFSPNLETLLSRISARSRTTFNSCSFCSAATICVSRRSRSASNSAFFRLAVSMYAFRVFHPRRAVLASCSAAFRAATPSSLQVFGQEIWPSYSSEPSQHSGSQTPSFTCDEGI